MSRKHETLLALVAERDEAERRTSLDRDAWYSANSRIIELMSPHKVGDVIEYFKSGRRHRLRLVDIAVGTLVRARAAGSSTPIDDMSIVCRGVVVRRNGTENLNGYASAAFRLSELLKGTPA